jgi:hypothetical protein
VGEECSEQRKLLGFVKLADFIICDTLHNLLLDSEIDLLGFTAPPPLPPPPVKSEEELAAEAEAYAELSPADKKAADEAKALAVPVPLFEVPQRPLPLPTRPRAVAAVAAPLAHLGHRSAPPCSTDAGTRTGDHRLSCCWRTTRC